MRSLSITAVVLAALLFVGCNQEVVTEEPSSDRPLLTEETVEAILAVEVDEESSQIREKALAQLQVRVEDLDPETLVSALDQLWLVDLQQEGDEYSTLPTALLFRDVLAALGGDDALAGGVRASIASRLRRAFLSWWYDAWLAQLGMEQIRAYIQSPFHYPPVEDRVREKARNQITAYHESAKKKLIKKLQSEQAKAQADADRLRAAGGSASEIDRLEQQVTAYGWAIDTIQSSMAAP